jgi:uncharacterized protein YjeT (DUF2065 family)
MISRHTARLVTGAMLAANGIAMLMLPAAWYMLMPGVAATGPLNLHFVRDIGAAYLAAGGGLLWLCRDPRAWPAAIAGSAFLSLHAMVHVGEAMAGALDWPHLARDLPGVFLVPIIALWLAWPRHEGFSTKENSNATMDRAAPARRL